MIDATFIEKILEVSNAEVVNLGALTYSTKNLFPIYEPEREALNLHSLIGLAAYVRGGIDQCTDVNNRLVIYIKNQESVRLIGTLTADSKRRIMYVHAEPIIPRQLINEWMDLESFIINLQTRFIQDDQTAAMLRILGNINDGTVAAFNDDGITQAVTVKKGVSLAERAPAPNLVRLRPYRTFTEIEQPESIFRLRMRSNQGSQPQCALFQADGNAWVIDALLKIEAWCTEHLPDIPVLG